MNIEPLGDRILVRMLALPKKTEGGIEIPETTTDNSPFKRAEVVAVGPGVEVLKVGDKVFLNNINPRSYIKEAGGDQHTYAILTEGNVQARLKD